MRTLIIIIAMVLFAGTCKAQEKTNYQEELEIIELLRIDSERIDINDGRTLIYRTKSSSSFRTYDENGKQVGAENVERTYDLTIDENAIVYKHRGGEIIYHSSTLLMVKMSYGYEIIQRSGKEEWELIRTSVYTKR